MTFGTESLPKVYKIFGPGNQFVTVAKQMATKYNVAIDMPAGPSELLVVGDDSADAAFVASDLLSQAEHGADSQVILVSLSKKLLEEVEAGSRTTIGTTSAESRSLRQLLKTPDLFLLDSER